MKRVPILLALAATIWGGQAFADSGNQVFFQYGWANLNTSRGHQVFTDTNGANGVVNDSKTGSAVGAGLDMDMIRDLGPGDLLGEIEANFSRYSHNSVRQTTSALLAGTANSSVNVTSLEVVVAPKYRFSFLDNKLRPWIIPIGLGFLVNSPPSNDSSYLDLGFQIGAGVEYAILKELSLGLDIRHTFAQKYTNIDTSNTTYGAYAGVNF